MTFEPDILLPGDVLLYRPGKLKNGFSGWFFGQVIAVKTWTDISHCEVYVGNGKAWASRDGLGVSHYPLRTEGLGFVLRPRHAIDTVNARNWFCDVANGQRYDWAGLLVFAHAVKSGSKDRMFCSEFVARLFRDGYRLPLFGDEWDSDRTPPSLLLATPVLEKVWSDGKDL